MRRVYVSVKTNSRYKRRVTNFLIEQASEWKIPHTIWDKNPTSSRKQRTQHCQRRTSIIRPEETLWNLLQRSQRLPALDNKPSSHQQFIVQSTLQCLPNAHRRKKNLRGGVLSIQILNALRDAHRRKPLLKIGLIQHKQEKSCSCNPNVLSKFGRRSDNGWCKVNQTLREKCPNTEFFVVRIFPCSGWIRRFTYSYSAQVRENTDQKKLLIWAIFTCIENHPWYAM